jgi:hypothetical protein
VKPHRVSTKPSNAIDAAESTGTRRADLPDILPVTTSRLQPEDVEPSGPDGVPPPFEGAVNAYFAVTHGPDHRT